MIHLSRFKQLKKYFAGVCCAASVATLLAGCGSVTPQTASDLVMDTVFTVTVYGDEVKPSELLEIGKDLDANVLSRFSEGSLVSEYNSGNLSEEVAAIVGRCDEINSVSSGAFDVRLGALSDLWDIDGAAKGETEFVIPSVSDIETALESRDIIDLGAVGKGIYLDEVKAVLDEKNVSGAVISAGGSILVYGAKPDGVPFKVGIKDPFGEDASGTFGIIKISGGYFISTSGSYERYIDLDGVRYHHILDPGTGYPAWSQAEGTCPVSVTIITNDGFTSDALSTACFVLGPDEGLKLAAQYSAEVIYIMNDGTVITSDGIITENDSRLTFTLK
jgi:thiamine biosynthesis lipoprotein